ncbi:XRE family transcriptional regulator (plasmid) [Photobacterium leiognathi subsp. mandapamensis]|uniref:XRE family transcriptional regulator n=1 Tax=Photobacterium leiognathi TaxID=553611 RepID=UPI003AF3C90A
MKDLGMKIKNERKKRGLKQKDLALLLNVTSQAISGWERGVTFPQLELYERIAIALNVSKDWLFFDDENKKKHNDADIFYAPFYSDIEASAGCGRCNEYSEVEEYPLPIQFVTNQYNKESIVCIRCNGDSMEPVISSGSILAINKSLKTINDGSIYVIKIHDVLRVKILQMSTNGIVIKSYNKEYADECVSFDSFSESRLEIIGKVIWYSSNLK